MFQMNLENNKILRFFLQFQTRFVSMIQSLLWLDGVEGLGAPKNCAVNMKLV